MYINRISIQLTRLIKIKCSFLQPNFGSDPFYSTSDARMMSTFFVIRHAIYIFEEQ